MSNELNFKDFLSQKLQVCKEFLKATERLNQYVQPIQVDKVEPLMQERETYLQRLMVIDQQIESHFSVQSDETKAAVQKDFIESIQDIDKVLSKITALDARNQKLLEEQLEQTQQNIKQINMGKEMKRGYVGNQGNAVIDIKE